MTAEIIAVGTEILLGDILNTNARYISQQIAALGISIHYQSVVGDNENRLKKTLLNALERASIIILTGGLGPTTDDLTKETIASALGLDLVLHEESKERIINIFKKINMPMADNNLKQALVPEGAIVLNNDNGTAPGFIIKKDEKMVIVLPGPPNEMIPMFELVKKELIKLNEGIIHSKTLKLCGIGESTVAEKLKSIIDNQTNPTIAPYAKSGEVHLRITAKADLREEADIMIKDLEASVRNVLGHHIFTDSDETIEETVVGLLHNKKLTLSIAESCTGGLLSGRIINCSGVSEVFKEGLITYSNESKMKYLNVSKETLDNKGAVSEETVSEMVQGLAERANTDVAIAVTGIAGPTGGTDDKPVGLVYIGLFYQGEIIVKKYKFTGNRQKIRNRAVAQGLTFLWNELL